MEKSEILKQLKNEVMTISFENLTEELKKDPDIISGYTDYYSECMTKGKLSRDLAISFVHISGLYLQYLAEDFRDDADIVIEAIKQNTESIQYATPRLQVQLANLVLYLMETEDVNKKTKIKIENKKYINRSFK